MWPRSPHKLSIEELEKLIRQRRTDVGRPLVGRQARISEPKQTPPGRRKRRGWEKLLLMTEILAVVAVLLMTGISARGWIALRQKLPTEGVTMVSEQVLAAPLPEVSESADPLPIGWRNSQAADLAGPAETRAKNQPLDTPVHLKRWLQPGSDTPAVAIPESVAQPATRLVIPSIGVDAPVGEGTDWESLKYKVGHHPGTANPGQRGNMVLAAHNDVFGEIFRYLPDLPVGEIITVYAGEHSFRYRITERRIIRPEQVKVMRPTTGPTTTLISCYPYLIDTHRIVLFGELVE